MPGGAILKKMNVSFIIHFCLGKYSFSSDSLFYYISYDDIFQNFRPLFILW